MVQWWAAHVYRPPRAPDPNANDFATMMEFMSMTITEQPSDRLGFMSDWGEWIVDNAAHHYQ